MDTGQTDVYGDSYIPHTTLIAGGGGGVGTIIKSTYTVVNWGYTNDGITYIYNTADEERETIDCYILFY